MPKISLHKHFKDLDTELQAIVHPLSDDEAMTINLM